MSIGSFFRESLSNAFRDMTHEVPKWGKEMVYKARLELWKVERRIMKNLTALFILLISFAALSIDFGYIFMEKWVELLSIGIFEPYDKLIILPQQLQITTFLISLLFACRLIYRNLFKSE